MSDVISVGLKVRSFESAAKFDGYTKVTILVADDLQYTAGDGAGRELVVTCPWGSQEMADNILAQIQDYQYQPYTARGAYLDPAAELGDYMSVNGLIGGIFAQDISFGRSVVSDVSAPSDEEIDHEYPYVPSSERKITRQYKEVKATLLVQADLISAEVIKRESDVKELSAAIAVQSDLISAKVSKRGGDSASFGWDLTDSSWVLSANGSEVLKATKDGISITGELNATSGNIGGCSIVGGMLQILRANISEKLTADEIDATNLKISSGNVTGKLTASQIDATNLKVSAANITGTFTVKTAAGNTLLSAGGNAVQIAGWNADSNSLHSGDSFAAAECFLCTGSSAAMSIGGSASISGWMIKAGSNFGVTKAGALYAADAYIKGKIEATSGSFKGTITAESGTIAGWTIDTYTADDDSVDYYSGSALIAEQLGTVASKVALTPIGVYYEYYNGSKTVTVYASWAAIVATAAATATTLDME